jgi:hypothetical protein
MDGSLGGVLKELSGAIFMMIIGFIKKAMAS